MDGFSMLRILQQAPELAHTTIVAVTGLDEATIAAKGGLPSGVLMLAKPIPFDRLQEIAIGIVNQSRYLLNTPTPA